MVELHGYDFRINMTSVSVCVPSKGGGSHGSYGPPPPPKYVPALECGINYFGHLKCATKLISFL